MKQEDLVKTTLTFNPLFHRQLKTWARVTNKSMSELIETELAPLLTQKQRERHRQVYDGLYALSGMVQEGSPDASETIDDFLYGKPGEGLESEECD